MQSRIEAPALVDADVLQPTAQKMLLAGQAAGHLQQLSSQLALEKAQRKAEMATTDYHIAAIAGMQERLPGLNQQLQVEQDAALLKAKQDEFDRKLGLEVSGQNRTLAVDAAADAARTARQTALNAGLAARAAEQTAGLNPLQQMQAETQSRARGTYLGNLGAEYNLPGNRRQQQNNPGHENFFMASGAPAGKPAASQTTDGVERGAGYDRLAQHLLSIGVTPDEASMANAIQQKGGTTELFDDPETGRKYRVTSLPLYGVISRTEIGRSAPNAAQNQKTLVQLTQAETQLQDTFAKLDEWNKSYSNRSGFLSVIQGMSAVAAGSRPSSTGLFAGLTSVAAKAAGSYMEAPETKGLRNSLAQLNQFVASMDEGTIKTLKEAGVLPEASSLGDPAALEATLNGLRSALQNKRNSLDEQAGVSDRAPPAAPAPKPTKFKPGDTSFTKNGVPIIYVKKPDGTEGFVRR